jgi:hypothetical protein
MNRILMSCMTMGAAAALAVSVPAMAQQSGGSSSSTSHTGTMSHEQLERQKIELTQKVDKAIDEASADLLTLQDMDQKARGAQKARYDALLQQIATRRNKLQADLGTIDRATVNDWTEVKSTVNRDFMRFDNSARSVAQLARTHRTGVANQQGTRPAPAR